MLAFFCSSSCCHLSSAAFFFPSSYFLVFCSRSVSSRTRTFGSFLVVLVGVLEAARLPVLLPGANGSAGGILPVAVDVAIGTCESSLARSLFCCSHLRLHSPPPSPIFLLGLLVFCLPPSPPSPYSSVLDDVATKTKYALSARMRR